MAIAIQPPKKRCYVQGSNIVFKKPKKTSYLQCPLHNMRCLGKKTLNGRQSIIMVSIKPPFFFKQQTTNCGWRLNDNSPEVVAIHWIIETKDVAHCKTFPWFPKISFTKDPKVEYGDWNWNSPTITTTIQRYPKDTSLGNLPKGVQSLLLVFKALTERGQTMCDGYVGRYAGVCVS